jgi:hypothetical protein
MRNAKISLFTKSYWMGHAKRRLGFVNVLFLLDKIVSINNTEFISNKTPFIQRDNFQEGKDERYLSSSDIDLSIHS